MSLRNFPARNVLKTRKSHRFSESKVNRFQSYSRSIALPKAPTLLAVIGLLLSAANCGSNSNNGPRTPPVSGNFSNASLNGSYAFTFQGTNQNGSFTEAGVFTADGNGNLTAGTVDFMQGTNFGSTPITGNYLLHNDGTGNLNLNFSGGTGAIQFGVALLDSSHLYVIETDATSTGVGLAEKQDTTAFATVPSGTFVFRLHQNSATQTSALLGAMTSTSGNLSGSADALRGGVDSAVSISSGSIIDAPASDGRGTMLINDSTGAKLNLMYYVVSANTLLFLQTDAGLLAIGRAEKQSAASFTNASLTGGFAFGSSGDTTSNQSGVHSVGAFATDGNGSITSGAYDSVQDGNVLSNVPLTGTYNVTSTGRTTATLNLQNGTSIQQVLWLVSPSRAFFLINSSSRVEDGTLDQRQGTSFSNTSLKGQYAIVMDGFDSQSLVDRVGTLKADGGGNLTLNEVVNRQGTISVPGFLPGTYSADANGRVAATVNNLSSGLVFYLISPSKAYVLQGDANTEISGQLAIQQ
jgi:hypothetical protein